jgi:hypothetical protein
MTERNISNITKNNVIRILFERRNAINTEKVNIMTSITALIITSLLIIVVGNTVNIDNIRD